MLMNDAATSLNRIWKYSLLISFGTLLFRSPKLFLYHTEGNNINLREQAYLKIICTTYNSDIGQILVGYWSDI